MSAFRFNYLDFDFQRLLDGFDLDDALLFVVQNFDGVLELDLESEKALDPNRNRRGGERRSEIYLDFLVAFVADAELASDFLVVLGDLDDLLFEFRFR